MGISQTVSDTFLTTSGILTRLVPRTENSLRLQDQKYKANKPYLSVSAFPPRTAMNLDPKIE
jgi:hypothetical protein